MTNSHKPPPIRGRTPSTGVQLLRAVGKGVQPPRTTYNEQTAGDLLSRIADGKYLKHAAQDMGLAPSTIYQWREANPQFAEALRIARHIGAEAMLADFQEELHSDEPTMSEGRLKIWQRDVQWYAERVAPSDYADLRARGQDQVNEGLAALLQRIESERAGTTIEGKADDIEDATELSD